MQVCRVCKSQQLDGTIFCGECGASFIITGHSRETTASLGQDQIVAPITATTVPAPEAVPAEPRLVLVVINSGRRMVLDVGEDLLVGRRDHTRGIFPDIDLELDGGYDAGVSRRHAIVLQREHGYLVEDLGSANGTFVNGKRLAPQTPTPIQHGDELAIGTLLLRVEVGAG